MTFNITSWKEQFSAKLPGWRLRMNAAGVNSAYFFIAASSLLPVIQAAHSADWSALAVLGTAVGGAVSTCLLANMVQKLRDKSEAEIAETLQTQVQTEPELITEINALFETLDA